MNSVWQWNDIGGSRKKLNSDDYDAVGRPDTKYGFGAVQPEKMPTGRARGFVQRFPKQELADRIYRYFEEVNAEPVVFHWKYKLDNIDIAQEPSVETLPLKKSG